MENADTYSIQYEFNFDDDSIKTFLIELDVDTISIVRPKPTDFPDWTLLKKEQCECCPLSADDVEYCPIAVNIAELVEEFKNYFSYDNCLVRCITQERTYEKKTSVQEGLFSIMGIIMPTSNCPVMTFLKPMARFHLPFSTIQETMVRSTSMYLLRQYFEHKKGRNPDLDMEKLDQHYENVQLVNKGILARISNQAEKDADRNALIILNSLAQLFSVEIDDNLTSVYYLFDTDHVHL
ncbi:MAG: DUF6901 family protein [Desulfosudaceae bacterium]